MLGAGAMSREERPQVRDCDLSPRCRIRTMSDLEMACRVPRNFPAVAV